MVVNVEKMKLFARVCNFSCKPYGRLYTPKGVVTGGYIVKKTL